MPGVLEIHLENGIVQNNPFLRLGNCGGSMFNESTDAPIAKLVKSFTSLKDHDVEVSLNGKVYISNQTPKQDFIGLLNTLAQNVQNADSKPTSHKSNIEQVIDVLEESNLTEG